jgi:predicted PurR-regulated permease PerM
MQQFEIPDIPLKQIVWWTLGILLVGGFFWLLLHFFNVVLLLLAAIILSTGLTPVINRLEVAGLSKKWGMLILFAGLTLLAILFIWFALPPILDQGAAIGGALGEGYTLLLEQLHRMPNIYIHRLLVALPPDLPSLLQATGEAAEQANQTDGKTMFEQLQHLVVAVFPVIAVILLAIYWTLEKERIRQAALLLVPIQRRVEVRELLLEIDAKVGGYLMGQGLLSLSIGILALIAYMLIGLPNALLLAVFAGLMEAVPLIGPFIGAIPAILIALTISPMSALWVVLATAVIQQIENNLLVPRVMKRTIGVSPLVTLLALIAFGSLFGILGALIALPLAAVIQLILERYLLSTGTLPTIDNGRDHLSRLRYETNQLVNDIRAYIRHKDSMPSAQSDTLEDEVEAIAVDLESYLAAQEQSLR